MFHHDLMPLKVESFVKGDEIHEIKVMETLKTPILNLYKTYPLYFSQEIIETYFEKEFGNKIVTKLGHDGFLEIKPKTNPKEYRLTPKGIEWAISMINLENSKKVLEASNKTNKLTDNIQFLTVLMAIIGLGTFILGWFQLHLLLS